MVHPGKLQRSRETHKSVHRRAENHVLAQDTGVPEKVRSARRACTVAVIAFRQSQGKVDAHLPEKRRTVSSGCQHYRVGLHDPVWHLNSARSVQVRLKIQSHLVRRDRPGIAE